MPRFFVPPIDGDVAVVDGENGHHLARVLRVRIGEELLLCDGQGIDYRCETTDVAGDTVTLRVIDRSPSAGEPHTKVTLYQGLPKSEKMEWIIQKAVELGVARIVPVAMSRCVVRLNGNDGKKKQVRWQKIAAEAAGQSGRGAIPTVSEPYTFAQAVKESCNAPSIVFYEGGGEPLGDLVGVNTTQLSIWVGPEGGFDPQEIEQLQAVGVQVATLGKRILRCETAPLAALAAIMALTDEM